MQIAVTADFNMNRYDVVMIEISDLAMKNAQHRKAVFDGLAMLPARNMITGNTRTNEIEQVEGIEGKKISRIVREAYNRREPLAFVITTAALNKDN